MNCPFCLQPRTEVLTTIKSSGATTKRTRRCCSCFREFKTQETPLVAPYEILKKDGRREQWDREKYKASVNAAFGKKIAQLHKVQIDKLAQIVEQYVRSSKTRQRPSSQVADVTIRRLHLINRAAAFRYASVYYNYSGDEFIAMMRAASMNIEMITTAANNLEQDDVS